MQKKIVNTISKNQKETEKIAKEFLENILNKECKNACVIGLSGDLGTGKTTFTQSVAKLLGIKGKIKSPTFVIMKRYPLKNSSSGRPTSGNFKNFFHLDAYRLKNAEELFNLGWKEIISNPEHLVFIEWPENVKKAMPKKHHKISIAHLPPARAGGVQAGIKEGYRSFKIKNA